MTEPQYHIQAHKPIDNWPRGSFSLYRITGDEIANRVVYAELCTDGGKSGNTPPFYRGDVIARHPWCGYIGLFETISEVMAAIRIDLENIERGYVDNNKTRPKHPIGMARLTPAGCARVLDGKPGMTFPVFKFTEGVSGRVAHVRDYTRTNGNQPFQTWSIPADGYELI